MSVKLKGHQGSERWIQMLESKPAVSPNSHSCVLENISLNQCCSYASLFELVLRIKYC